MADGQARRASDRRGLAGGRRRAELRPRLVLWPELDLGYDTASADAPQATRVDVEQARRTLIGTRLCMRDPGGAPSARIEDWISDPAPPTAARPVTAALRVDDLVALDGYRIHITRDPDLICWQITRLLPTGPLPASP